MPSGSKNVPLNVIREAQVFRVGDLDEEAERRDAQVRVLELLPGLGAPRRERSTRVAREHRSGVLRPKVRGERRRDGELAAGGITRQSGPMGEEVSHRDIARAKWVHNLEARASAQVRIDRLIESERTLLDQLHHRSRRIRLAHRARRKDRGAGHGRPIGEVRGAEALLPDNGSVSRDGDLYPAHAVDAHDLGDEPARGRNESRVVGRRLRGGCVCTGERRHHGGERPTSHANASSSDRSAGPFFVHAPRMPPGGRRAALRLTDRDQGSNTILPSV